MNSHFIIALLLVLLAAWVISAYVVNSTRWWLCHICWHWHNQIGERTEKPPVRGMLESQPKVCQCCARRAKL